MDRAGERRDDGTDDPWHPADRFHRHPPYSPARFFARPFALELGTAFAVLLAVLAAFDGGSLLLRFDEPIQEWVVDARTPAWTRFFDAGSRLGDNLVVFPSALVLSVWTWRHCRLLAYAVVVAVVVRPGFEFVLKELVDRARPDVEPLSDFMGPSHPSGHPLAATSVWGLLPPIVAVHGASRRLWWVVTIGVSVVIVVVAGSRVYRGAHWSTDVVASVVWATLYLAAVETVYTRLHDRFGWRGI